MGIELSAEVKINGKKPEEFRAQVNELILAIEKAKSLAKELSDDMALIKFEITSGQE